MPAPYIAVQGDGDLHRGAHGAAATGAPAPDPTPSLADRAAGVLLDQAAGGDLGGFAPGQCSDDTQMAVAIARVAATGADLTGEAALDAVADGLLARFAAAPPDVGTQTRRVLAGQRPGPGSAARLRGRAAAVAAARAVAELTHADPDAGDSCVPWSQSLGVITFGVQQANRIEAELLVLKAADTAFAAALDQLGGQNEKSFVKSIERVQGDERDAIILSFDHGRRADGTVGLQWGPLLDADDKGYRRVNVAISRSKRRMTFVTPFEADELADGAHPSRAFSMIHRFLRFAASGGTEVDTAVATHHPMNAFEQDIHDRLVEAGLDLVPQLGVGSYRLDFAVRHPEHPGRFVLAVEADGASYHSGATARERDRLRQQLLEGRGWRFTRIWSTDWFNDPATVVERVLADYRAALVADAAAPVRPDQPLRTHDTAPGAPVPAARPAPGGKSATEPSWHVATSQRHVPLPRLRPGSSISNYDDALLRQVVAHVRSDGVLRTHDEEFDELMKLLGFARRGQRIVAALQRAQAWGG